MTSSHNAREAKRTVMMICAKDGGKMNKGLSTEWRWTRERDNTNSLPFYFLPTALLSLLVAVAAAVIDAVMRGCSCSRPPRILFTEPLSNVYGMASQSSNVPVRVCC